MEPQWWHDQLSGRSLALFDLSATIVFAVAGLALTWASRTWAPISLWHYSWASNSWLLSSMRISLVGLVTALAFAGMVIGNRFKLVDLPKEERFLTSFKLLGTALLAWGCFFVYHHDPISIIPMAGLTVISLMLLFRVELTEALKMAAYLGLVGLPVVLSGWLA